MCVYASVRIDLFLEKRYVIEMLLENCTDSNEIPTKYFTSLQYDTRSKVRMINEGHVRTPNMILSIVR